PRRALRPCPARRGTPSRWYWPRSCVAPGPRLADPVALDRTEGSARCWNCIRLRTPGVYDLAGALVHATRCGQLHHARWHPAFFFARPAYAADDTTHRARTHP